MSLGYAILGFLDREHMTGYELKTRCFDETTAHIWPADQAQVYRTLDSLERKELVSSETVIQHGRPNRKVYSITTAGRRALSEWLADPHDIPQQRDAFLLQILLSSRSSDDELVDILESARDKYRQRLEGLESRASASPGPRNSPRDRRDRELEGMTLKAAIDSTRMTVDWIETCLARISAGIPGRAAGYSRPLLER